MNGEQDRISRTNGERILPHSRTEAGAEAQNSSDPTDSSTSTAPMSQPESTAESIRRPIMQHDQQSAPAARDDTPDEPCSVSEMQHAHQGGAAGSEGGQGNDWTSRGGVPPGIASLFMSVMAGIRGAFGQEGPNVRRPEEARGNDAAPPAANARPQSGSDSQNAEEGTQGSAPADPEGSAAQGGQQRRGVAIRLFGLMPPVPPPSGNAPPMPGGSPGDAGAQANGPGGQDANARPAEASATEGPEGSTEYNGEAPQNGESQERRLPQFLLYVSREASPLPFGFLYDAATGMAWPVINQPTDNPSEDGTQTINVIGTPFHVQFNVQPAAPPEEPDPEHATAFVRGMERADAELRSRMARLGMGDLGGTVPHVGCGICLEPYAEEDTPAWFVGEQQEQDMAVVAVPCGGFHTLHAACLQSWLASLPPSKWTCPFCRSPLTPPPKHTNENQRVSHTQEESTPAKPTRTLREEVHLRERQQGWRCDAPACLPRYEMPKADGSTHGLDSFSSELVRLNPCRHEVHVDCLCMSMRVEAAEAADRLELEYDGVSDAESEDGETQAPSYSNLPVDAQVNEEHGRGATVGKWVTCAACRKDAWAQLPARRRPQRNGAQHTN